MARNRFKKPYYPDERFHHLQFVTRSYFSLKPEPLQIILNITWTWVLNAKDYGVPQSRKRVFVGGILDQFSPLLPATASHAVTVREAIRDLTFLSEGAFPQLFDTDELQLDEKPPSLEAQLPSTYSSSNRYSLHHPQLILTYSRAVASPVTLHQLLNDSMLPHRERRSQKAVYTAVKQ